jgi:asparagine synthase (glutamine-hydrolysing)
MCGIAGSVNAFLPRETLKLIAHRGPDSEGYEEINVGDNIVYLAQTRLSIIELSSAGSQPMFSECGNYCLVFNGEIYNHLDLREQLTEFNFKGHSDTETILYYIIKFGIDGIKNFNGIFAFGFLDIRKCTIYLARDQFGVKPIYYFYDNNKLIFGSELKIILSNSAYKKQMDLNALSDFLYLRYNPSPNTMFQNIKRIEAATYIKFEIGKSFNKVKYWQSIPLINKNILFNEAVEEYQFLLERAVKRQLLSDVPVGLFLSGGVDSAVIGYLMQKHSNNKINTFTVGFEGVGDFNETVKARETADFIGSKHHEELINYDQFHSYFTNSFFHTEEPIAEPTIPALMHVSKMASKEVKVVLSGQGADEPLAGYQRYYGEQLLSKYSKTTNFFANNLLRLFKGNESVQRAIYASKFSKEFDRFFAIYAIFTPEMQSEILKNGIINNNNFALLRSLFRGFYSDVENLGDSLSKMLYIDTRTMLPDNLLLFNDKNTMAYSIENRVPFLDIDLINFIETLPPSFKLNGRVHKFIHKKAVEKWLPEKIVYARKRAFSTPVDDWFKGVLGKELYDLIDSSDSIIKELFNIDVVKKMISDHNKGLRNYKKQLFALLSLEMWYQKFYKIF